MRLLHLLRTMDGDNPVRQRCRGGVVLTQTTKNTTNPAGLVTPCEALSSLHRTPKCRPQTWQQESGLAMLA